MYCLPALSDWFSIFLLPQVIGFEESNCRKWLNLTAASDFYLTAASDGSSFMNGAAPTFYYFSGSLSLLWGQLPISCQAEGVSWLARRPAKCQSFLVMTWKMPRNLTTAAGMVGPRLAGSVFFSGLAIDAFRLNHSYSFIVSACFGQIGGLQLLCWGITWIWLGAWTNQGTFQEVRQVDSLVAGIVGLPRTWCVITTSNLSAYDPYQIYSNVAMEHLPHLELIDYYPVKTSIFDGGFPVSHVWWHRRVYV